MRIGKRESGDGVAYIDHAFHFGCVEYEMFVGYPGGCIRLETGYMQLNLKNNLGRKLRLENIVYILKNLERIAYSVEVQILQGHGGNNKNSLRVWVELCGTGIYERLIACVFSHVQLCNPMDHSLLGFSVHGIFQARILEWVLSPGESSELRNRTCISCNSCIAVDPLHCRQILHLLNHQ